MSALAAYEAGLDSRADCWLQTPDGARRRVPVRRWLADADARDAAIVEAVLERPLGASASCPPASSRVSDPLAPPPHGAPHGAAAPLVLDVGCGPGRLTAALSRAGAFAVGLDVSTTAVAITRARGGAAIHGNVFGSVPGAGTWECVLLADGNLGIGGDPQALLIRAAELLTPGGRVVADVEPAGGIRRSTAWLDTAVTSAGGIGGPLPWAWVGAAAVPRLAAAAGLCAEPVRRAAGRSIAIWSKPA